MQAVLICAYLICNNLLVMLPLNTFDNNGNLENPSVLLSQLQQLKSGNVDGYDFDILILFYRSVLLLD